MDEMLDIFPDSSTYFRNSENDQEYMHFQKNSLASDTVGHGDAGRPPDFKARRNCAEKMDKLTSSDWSCHLA
jgi:hypothetical protein